MHWNSFPNMSSHSFSSVSGSGVVSETIEYLVVLKLLLLMLTKTASGVDEKFNALAVVKLEVTSSTQLLQLKPLHNLEQEQKYSYEPKRWQMPPLLHGFGEQAFSLRLFI